MPAPVLARFGDWDVSGETLIAKLNATADTLQVTASALKWRLVFLDRLSQDAARAIPDAALRHNGRKAKHGAPPPLFSKPFMEVLGLAIDEGRVSVRRAANLVDLTTDDLAEVFAAHGVAAPFEP